MMQPGTYWYEDLKVGASFLTGGIVVGESLVFGFAGLTGDFFDLHVDDEFARQLGFKRRVAHGLLGLALADGLKNRAEVKLPAVALLGVNWKFLAPIYIGDRIHVVVTIANKRQTKRPDRGVANLHYAVKNQNQKIVQEGEVILMVRCRPQDRVKRNSRSTSAVDRKPARSRA